MHLQHFTGEALRRGIRSVLPHGTKGSQIENPGEIEKAKNAEASHTVRHERRETRFASRYLRPAFRLSLPYPYRYAW